YSVVYTESLFLFLTVGAFYAMRRRYLLLAALAGLAAGLTRPNGLWLALPLLWMATRGEGAGLGGSRGPEGAGLPVGPASAAGGGPPLHLARKVYVGPVPSILLACVGRATTAGGAFGRCVRGLPGDSGGVLLFVATRRLTLFFPGAP